MTKSTKSNTNESDASKDVETSDAVPIEDAVKATIDGEDTDLEPSAESAPDIDAPDDIDVTQDGGDDVSEDHRDDIEDVPEAETVDDVTSAQDVSDEIDDEPVAEPVAAANSGAGFMGFLLGGVAAGAIGYGVATYYPMNGGSDDIAMQVSAQADQIAALEAQLADVSSVDLSGVESQIEALQLQTTERSLEITEWVNEGMVEFDARLTEVEMQPNADGTLSDTALAAYRQELEELRAELDAQQANVMSAAAQAEADLAAARAEAEALEQDALAAAEAAVSRAALNRVKAAVDTGAPFADAIGDLGGDVPAVLTSVAQSGVATNADLMDDFPAAARAALSVARSEGVSGEAGGFGAFFRNQFDVRSTAPQEGTTPDAILSRAEAAVKDGRIADALAEIEALPEVVRAELTDWTARATQRAEVLDAIATLSETYN